MNATASLDLIDVIDMATVPGEYVGCSEKSEFTVFGETVVAFHRYHAARLVCGKKFDSRCECCGHALRYCHVTQDQAGAFHCHGYTCLSIETMGEDSVRRFNYSRKIDKKKTGFAATFNVPAKFWEMDRSSRPQWAKAWKGRPAGRSQRAAWKLTVWGSCFEECLDRCMEATKIFGLLS